ncbi:hypothetical protein E3A20_16940, partial [Planctomyces bekefii]
GRYAANGGKAEFNGRVGAVRSESVSR